MDTYLFYDIETTGLHKAFDQVLQFACIRTDLHFQEKERHTFTVKLNRDVVPSPGAVITHLMTPQQTQQATLNECEALQKIHALLNTPGTTSLGYNTLGFDDEFLRFSFYKNLLTPYTHQYAQHCTRQDLYPMVVFYYLFKKSALKWPCKNGLVSLKLEDLNEANQFFEGQAHDALVDVEVTLALAKKLAQETETWAYLSGYFNKKIDQERFLKLPTVLGTHRVGLYIEGKLGLKNRFQAPVLDLGEHRHYKNQRVFLRLDLAELRSSTHDTVAEATWTFKKKWGEPGFLLPLQERFTQDLSSERKHEQELNIRWLQEQPDLLQAIIEYHLEFKYAADPATDVAAALYVNDFWSPHDVLQCVQFHKTPLIQKAQSLHHFATPSLRTLALRLLGRHYYDTLDTALQHEFDDYLKKSLHHAMMDFKGEPKLTVQKALEIIEQLCAEQVLNEKQLHALTELQIYLKDTL